MECRSSPRFLQVDSAICVNIWCTLKVVSSSTHIECCFTAIARTIFRIHHLFKRILIQIPLNVVPKGLINNNKTLLEIMAWRPTGEKPPSELMMPSLLMHLCLNRSQWIMRIMVDSTCDWHKSWLILYQTKGSVIRMAKNVVWHKQL